MSKSRKASPARGHSAAAASEPVEKPFRLSYQYLCTGILSWLLPGAGHWLLGYRVRATVICVSLLGAFWTGESLLADNLAVTREVHPVFFCLQAGNGFSAFLADGLWGDAIHQEENTRKIHDDLPVDLNLGILLCSVSGLLNLLVVLHVFDPRTWREAARDAEADTQRRVADQPDEACPTESRQTEDPE